MIQNIMQKQAFLGKTATITAQAMGLVIPAQIFLPKNGRAIGVVNKS